MSAFTDEELTQLLIDLAHDIKQTAENVQSIADHLDEVKAYNLRDQGDNWNG